MRWLIYWAMYFCSLAIPFLVIVRFAIENKSALKWLWLPSGAIAFTLLASAERSPHLVIVCAIAGGAAGWLTLSKTAFSLVLVIAPLIAFLTIFDLRLPPGAIAHLHALFYKSPIWRAIALTTAASIHVLMFSIGAGSAWIVIRILRRKTWQFVPLFGIAAMLFDSSLVLSLEADLVMLSSGLIGAGMGKSRILQFGRPRKSWLLIALATFCWGFLNEGIWNAFVVPQRLLPGGFGVNTFQWAVALIGGMSLSYSFVLSLLLFQHRN